MSVQASSDVRAAELAREPFGTGEDAMRTNRALAEPTLSPTVAVGASAVNQPMRFRKGIPRGTVGCSASTLVCRYQDDVGSSAS